MDPLGARGDCREPAFGSRYREIRPVMLADAKRIDAELVGEDRFLDQVADNLRMGLRPAVTANGDVAECVQPKLKLLCHNSLRKPDPAPERIVLSGIAPEAQQVGGRGRCRNGPAGEPEIRPISRKKARRRSTLPGAGKRLVRFFLSRTESAVKLAVEVAPFTGN